MSDISENSRTRDRVYWLKIWLDFKSGDSHAFELIYNQFVDVLFAYGTKIVHDRELVKDSIQDLFVDIYHYTIDLHHPEYLEYYLFKSLKRILIQKQRQNNRYDSISKDHNKSFHLKFDFEEKYLEDESEIERKKSVNELMSTLDEEKRELLFLKFNTGLSYIQIGQVLHMKPDTVKKQVYRLLEQLRKKHGARLIDLLVISSLKKK